MLILQLFWRCAGEWGGLVVEHVMRTVSWGRSVAPPYCNGNGANVNMRWSFGKSDDF